jgi:5-hydroxyisourate hydrolase
MKLELAMGRLTTHVLDTARGVPAANLDIDLYKIVDSSEQKIKSVSTNIDGRCDKPLLEGGSFKPGKYKLIFHATPYLEEQGDVLPKTPFLDQVVIAFGIDDAEQHYHVPLLLSAYGYSTYRGS